MTLAHLPQTTEIASRLQIAALHGRLDAARSALLLASSLGSATENRIRWEALGQAIVGNQKECFEFLLPSLPDPAPSTDDAAQASALIQAVLNDRPAFIASLLPLSDPRTELQGRNALHWAATSEWFERLIPSLLAGGQKSFDDFSGQGAMALAASRGNAMALAAMMPFADPNAPDCCGLTPLMHAARSGSAECVDLLLESSNLAARDHSGATAATHARQAGIPHLAARLRLASGARQEKAALLECSLGPSATSPTAHAKIRI